MLRETAVGMVYASEIAKSSALQSARNLSAMFTASRIDMAGKAEAEMTTNAKSIDESAKSSKGS